MRQQGGLDEKVYRTRHYCQKGHCLARGATSCRCFRPWALDTSHYAGDSGHCHSGKTGKAGGGIRETTYSMKRLLLLLPIVLLLVLSIPGIVLADDPPTLYENFQTGNWTSNHIAGVNWTSQSFTVGDVSHTATSVWVSINRTGVPGYTYLLLYDTTAGGLPEG